MALTLAWVVLLLFCSSYQFRGGAGLSPFKGDPQKEWDRLANLTETIGPETKLFKSASGDQLIGPQPKNVPEYVIVSSVDDPMELLKPEKSVRRIPDRVKTILQRTSQSSANVSPTRPPLVEILCHLDRIYVRIMKSVFQNRYAYKDLRLGNCPVNQGNSVHYYFLYLLTTNCGYNNEKYRDYSSITNTLRYNPAGVVLRAMPFNIPLQCKYYRFFHTYRVGFYPKLQGGTILKALSKSGFTLTSQDASGNPITGTRTYTLGQLMYFEAKRSESIPSSKRVYINKCVMTASLDPNSTPQHVVIHNQGCMLESKFNPQAKFLTGMSNMAQRFRVGAMLFKGAVSTSSAQQIYMHCDISIGNRTPTQSSKACTYDSTTRKWRELYGNDDVCACCDSTCAAIARASKKMIASHSWKVDLSNKDGYDKIDNWMKRLVDEPSSPEDPAKTDANTS